MSALWILFLAAALLDGSVSFVSISLADRFTSTKGETSPMREIVNLTPDVVACIGDVRTSAAPNYQQEKLLLSMKTQHPDRELTPEDLQAASSPATPVSIATKDKLPQMHAQQRE